MNSAAPREDFGFETTLSGRTHAHLLSGLKRDGYRVVLFFLWLPMPTWLCTGWPTGWPGRARRPRDGRAAADRLGSQELLPALPADLR